MRRVSFVAVLVFVLVCGRLAVAQVDGRAVMDMIHGISVSGTAEVSAAPDIAYVTLGVRSRVKTAAEAVRDNAGAMNRVMEALKRGGIGKADIETVQYSLQPVYEYPQNSPQRLVGYEATNMVRVTVRDLTRVGTLVDATSAAGANVVQDVSFSVRDESTFRAKALALAAQDAKSKAATIATAFGVSLGRLTDVNESGTPVVIPYVLSAESAKASTPISPQQVQVRASLTVTFAIDP